MAESRSSSAPGKRGFGRAPRYAMPQASERQESEEQCRDKKGKCCIIGENPSTALKDEGRELRWAGQHEEEAGERKRREEGPPVVFPAPWHAVDRLRQSGLLLVSRELACPSHRSL